MVKLNITAPRASVPVAESDLVEAACEALQASEFIRQEFKDLDEMIQVQDNLILVKNAISKSDDVHGSIKVLDVVEGMESLLGVAELKLTKEAAMEGLGQKIIDGFKAAIKKIRDFFMRIYNWVKEKFTKKQADVTAQKAEEVVKEVAKPEVKKAATPEKVAAATVNDKTTQNAAKRCVRGSFATLGEALDLLSIQAPAASGSAPSGGVKASMEGLSDAINHVDDTNRVDHFKADVELPALSSIMMIVLITLDKLLDIVGERIKTFDLALKETDASKFSSLVTELNKSCDALKQLERDTENRVAGYAEARKVERKEGETVTLSMLGIKTREDLEKYCNSTRENAIFFRDKLYSRYLSVEGMISKVIGTQIPEEDDAGMLRQKIEIMRRLAKFSHRITDTATGIRSEIDDSVNMMNSVVNRFKSQQAA